MVPVWEMGGCMGGLGSFGGVGGVGGVQSFPDPHTVSNGYCTYVGN